MEKKQLPAPVEMLIKRQGAILWRPVCAVIQTAEKGRMKVWDGLDRVFRWWSVHAIGTGKRHLFWQKRGLNALCQRKDRSLAFGRRLVQDHLPARWWDSLALATLAATLASAGVVVSVFIAA